MTLVTSGTVTAQGDQDRQVQIHSADSTAELRMVQAEQALAANEIGEAINLLQKVSDEADGRLVAFPPSSLNEAFPITRHVPIETKVAWIRNNWANTNAEASAKFRESIDAAVRQQLDATTGTADLDALRRNAAEAKGSTHEIEALVRLGDAYLYRGWVNAARDCFQRTSVAWRAPVGSEGKVASTTIPWHLVLKHLKSDGPLPESVVSYFKSLPPSPLGAIAVQATPSMEIGARLVWCSILEGDLDRARLERRLLDEAVPGDEQDKERWLGKVDQWLEQAGSKSEARRVMQPEATFAQDTQRSGLSFSNPSLLQTLVSNGKPGSMAWDQRLPRRTGTYEQLPDGLPRVGENSQGLLAYHPVIQDDKVFVNEFNRIVAYDLNSGRSWPDAQTGVALYSHSTPDDQIAPLGYPAVGVPRGTLSILDGTLYARVGPSVTGWRNPSEFAVESQSAIVGLDLRSEGRMLSGYPIRLSGEQWEKCEFEGTPIAIDDCLYVGVTQRNSVQLRRFIACFDRYRGTLRWKSPLLAGALPHRAELANVISHQLVSYNQGRLFYDTGLGSIVALDAATGKIEWLVRYSRVDAVAEAYPRSHRFRQRDLTPPLIHGDLVICAPADCREVFALDWSTGDLIWATDPGVATDAVQMLGVSDRSLLVSGDRLSWLDISTGKLQARFPESGMDLPGHALPYPRGMGRGVLVGDSVLWPAAGKLLVFDSRLVAAESARSTIKPPLVIEMDSRLGEGANIICHDSWLIFATPSRLMTFQPSAPAP